MVLKNKNATYQFDFIHTHISFPDYVSCLYKGMNVYIVRRFDKFIY